MNSRRSGPRGGSATVLAVLLLHLLVALGVPSWLARSAPPSPTAVAGLSFRCAGHTCACKSQGYCMVRCCCLGKDGAHAEPEPPAPPVELSPTQAKAWRLAWGDAAACKATRRRPRVAARAPPAPPGSPTWAPGNCDGPPLPQAPEPTTTRSLPLGLGPSLARLVLPRAGFEVLPDPRRPHRPAAQILRVPWPSPARA